MSLFVIQHTVKASRNQTGWIGIACLQQASYSTKPQKTNLAAMKRGTGGRSSFNGVVATVFGATGFTGRYVCNKLGKIGTQLIIPYRGDFYPAQRLKCVGDLGQVLFTPYNLRDRESIDKAIRYSNVVINLVGRDWETKNFKFDDVHVEGARTLARACREAGVEKLIHVSSLSASPNPEGHCLPKGSGFLRSKYYGELAVKEEFPDAIIFRPGVIYGSEDRFLRYFAHPWRRQIHYMPMWDKGEKAVKQPVYVSDFAQGIVNAIRDPDAVGKTFQAVGPRRYKLGELVDYFHRVMRKQGTQWGYKRYDLRYDPTFWARISLTEKLCPGWPVGYLHWEQIERECVTDQVIPGVPTLEDLDVKLTLIEHQAPWELRGFRAYAYNVEELGDFEDPAPPKVFA
ncbi:NADH dehydrogenase [ubiquinone] 1 alpha subcomplex subunit 9, mitochondrial-like [Ctenocephalides felis]|uniref:NADH dehydrogenase [ubiquinone] 1 alpha subcomplex subunit 9, mitochondrial-like n=1 Tax=Ctenocephalides felis TaxID=7515 RepID=UPI000E6E2DA1|nr:NADH dehydrogenase [ubiquinone] 1 alpha subcomplex subunit 9, mitochondrial-like [Ctenocephalides felis]